MPSNINDSLQTPVTRSSASIYCTSA